MDILNCARNINKSHETDVLARLTTVWGENLDPEHILDEYPRPQLKRDNYTILNGYWNYAITKSPALPGSYDGKILVPFSPESILSGVERQLKPDEYLWYERSCPPMILPPFPLPGIPARASQPADGSSSILVR